MAAAVSRALQVELVSSVTPKYDVVTDEGYLITCQEPPMEFTGAVRVLRGVGDDDNTHTSVTVRTEYGANAGSAADDPNSINFSGGKVNLSLSGGRYDNPESRRRAVSLAAESLAGLLFGRTYTSSEE